MVCPIVMGFILDGVDLLLMKHKTDIMSMKEKFSDAILSLLVLALIAGVMFMAVNNGN